MASPPLHRAEPDVEGLVEVVGDAALGEDVAHVDEQRDRQQRVPVHQGEGLVERDLLAAGAPEQDRGDRADEADRAEHALPGQEQHQHAGEHRQRDQLGAHAIGRPRRVARSRKKKATACRIISRRPKHITSLIGASGGRQAVAARWPYSSAYCGRGDAAHQHHDEVGDQADRGDRVGEGALSRLPALVEQVHADVAAELQRPGAAEDVVGGQQELRHLDGPERRPVEAGAHERRVEQDADHDEDEVHADAAEEAADRLDPADVGDDQRRQGRSPGGAPHRNVLSCGCFSGGHRGDPSGKAARRQAFVDQPIKNRRATPPQG